MVKVVTLFLIGILVLAMFGKLRLPGRRSRRGKGGLTIDARKCPRCGRHVIGTGPCDCDNNSTKGT